jgi:hypothetical protein
MTDNTDRQQYESPKEALQIGGKDAGYWQMWMGAIAARSKGSEGDWRKRADDVVKVYRSEKEQGNAERTPGRQTAFNVLYSNTETLLPALYNSQPIPDIRRRFGDPGKPGKAVAQILERALTYSLDRYDFEAELKPTIFDSCVPGRGVGRVRLIPKIEGAENDDDEDGLETPEQESDEHADLMTPPEKGEKVTGHEVRYEYVHWKNYRQGPGLVWSDVPWIAFEHFMSKEQLEDLLDGRKDAAPVDDIPLNWDAEGAKNETTPDQANAGRSPDGDIFKRAHVWEIWDKKNREVIWLCTDYPWKVLCRVKDPLQLEGFFPLPRPLVPIDTPGDMTPVPPYEAYRELAEELNEVSDRIRRLARQIRVRGLYSTMAQDIQNLTQAADGELVPVENLDIFLTAGGDLNKIIGWWPIEPQVAAIKELVEQRERIKETINEVSGLSDILRGQTEASETATAQNIKSQWGSLRIQRMQQEIARYVRDIFRIKAELIANHFDIGFLSKMTGVELATERDKKIIQQKLQVIQQQAQGMVGPDGQPAPPPQPPQKMLDYLDLPTVEEVKPLLRDDLMRSFKIDVESDSTIRADLTRNQQVMGEFVNGTAAYIQAVGPAVQAGLMPANVAVDIYSAFARNFKLGKQVEDSLEKLAENATKQAQQPQPPKQDPEMVKAQAEIQMEQQRLQMEQQKAEADAALQQKKLEAELALKQMELQAKLQLEQQKHEQEALLKQQQAEMESAMAADRHEREMQMAQQAHESTLQRDMEAHTIGLSQKDEAHRTSLMQADEAHKTKVGAEQQAADIRVKEWQAKQKATEDAKKPKGPRSVKFKRGTDGRIAAAEIA